MQISDNRQLCYYPTKGGLQMLRNVNKAGRKLKFLQRRIELYEVFYWEVKDDVSGNCGEPD